MRKEEEYTLYKQHDENKIATNTFKKGLEKAGKILLVSNVDFAPENVFLMYKKRDTVEKHYDTYKSMWKQTSFIYRIMSRFSVIFSSRFCLFMAT